MNSQKELSYDRLASRTKFYQEKSLELEKKLVFAEDKIDQLELQLKEALENDELERQLEAKENKVNQLQSELDQLKNEVSLSNLQAMEQKVEGFEELLEAIEKELNEKEKQIESYKSKIKSLEKRVKVQKYTPEEVETEPEEKEQADYQLSSYFNYSVICKDKESYVIHGSFHMTNTGEKPLENPLLCFRFQPADYTNLKGKINSLDQGSINPETKENIQWVYVDNDWAEEAKSRGEIWIASMYDFQIPVSRTISLTDFQIPIQKQFEDSVVVEAFVYFQKEDYRARAMNQISINF
ncbi:hypothetical protein [Pseudalkalibacillus salsuginis]|uniref:hypothetical protein n=1 Tax=Pseudalkalibacillus salsuginis TaxID=2910972 RepID=UPI001F1AAAA5|nr:hypothetical protein [Pseudalkalibacillus salsuginis]MCF6409143.1 hypothetical protein [Pseudalkalibacillus salsuginis]